MIFTTNFQFYIFIKGQHDMWKISDKEFNYFLSENEEKIMYDKDDLKT